MSLNARQRRAAHHVARGLSQAQSAKRVGVHPKTVTRWKQEVPGFEEACVDPVSSASQATPVETLEDLLNDDDPKVRLAASVAILKIDLGDLPDQPVQVTVVPRA